MVSTCHRCGLATAVLLLFCGLPNQINGGTITTAPSATSTTSTPETCEFRTINYITDSLPQLCGKSSWSNANATTVTKVAGDSDLPIEGQTFESASSLSSDLPGQHTTTAGSDSLAQESTIPVETLSGTFNPATSTVIAERTNDIEAGELNEASFLSFEEWKKQTLEKAGQPNVNIGHKNSVERKKESDSIQNHLDSLGDEGEIDLDFGAFGGESKGEELSQAVEPGKTDAQHDSQDRGSVGRQYRSKDAGITCKERFSYASFDAGATILKTHAGAKNPKAVLIENKDTYMLSECSAENKFLIIELSEDIWIDTLVLANYEFFSSMIRNFRVSVSDRYPVKIEKWKDLGTYEARNSREIQAFLIENPQIWARYIRIEFLSHYGNEYYCPLSLVRVHGTRMLESWKETEAIGEDDDAEDGEGHGAVEQYIPDAIADEVQEEERLNAELKEAQAAIKELIKTAEVVTSDQLKENSSQIADLTQSLENASFPHSTSLWAKPKIVDLLDSVISSETFATCAIADAPTVQSITSITSIIAEQDLNSNSTAHPAQDAASTPTTPTTSLASTPSLASETSQPTQEYLKSNSTHSTSSFHISDPSAARTISDVQESISSTAASTTSKQNTTSSKNKTTGTSSASSSLPTIQESFFKAVSRRLQLLETNSTLSLKYIEEQSRILREAFSKVEKKQLQKTTAFLDSLNSTVLAELRVFRQQYDEIWQSTVISLESQRDESRREILAISSRLNILADEVVFQKRMSIVQSVLLLLCLGLVIFSRVSVAGQLDLQNIQIRTRALRSPGSPVESPPESPEYRRTISTRERERWLGLKHRRQHSDGSPISKSCSRENSPPTPASKYSTSDTGLSPALEGDDLSRPSHVIAASEHLQIPLESETTTLIPTHWQDGYTNDAIEPSSPGPYSSPARTPRRRKGFIRQEGTPPAAGLESSFEESQAHVDSSTRDSTWEGNDCAPRLSSLPSPPRGGERFSFSIARKPLPALPINDKT